MTNEFALAGTTIDATVEFQVGDVFTAAQQRELFGGSCNAQHSAMLKRVKGRVLNMKPGVDICTGPDLKVGSFADPDVRFVFAFKKAQGRSASGTSYAAYMFEGVFARQDDGTFTRRASKVRIEPAGLPAAVLPWIVMMATGQTLGC